MQNANVVPTIQTEAKIGDMAIVTNKKHSLFGQQVEIVEIGDKAKIVADGNEHSVAWSSLELVATTKTMAGTLKAARAGYEDGVCCGDQLALALKSTPLEVTTQLATWVVGKGDWDAMAAYGHLNNGQIRMNSGNKIRGALKRGDIAAELVLNKLVALSEAHVAA